MKSVEVQIQQQYQPHDQIISSFEQSPPHQVVVVMVPFPVQSHLNQLLQLSCLISSSSYQIPVHYAASATHIQQVKLRFNGAATTNLPDLSKIQFHDLPTQPFHSPPPKPNAAAATRFPAHLQPSFEATLRLREPFASLLNKISLTAQRVVVIHDVLMSYVVQDLAAFPNAESYVFNPISAFTSFFDGWQMMGKSFQVDEPEGLPSLEGCHTSELVDFVGLQTQFLKFSSGTIFNSCREIEGAYIDLLGTNDRVWAIGPLNPAGKVCENRDSITRPGCLEWLDKQAPLSVLYVSFGTLTSMTDEQIKEIAIGLEKSEQKFIWVLRDADRGDIFAGDVKKAKLPEGYEERLKGVGMVVRDWAPQLEILGHPSTGGFMSHCGWNSCLESITAGVPIAAWPMHSDQPKNAFLVTDILKIGLAVTKWEHRNEVVTSSTIAGVVKALMASEDEKGMRKNVKQLGAAARKSVEEGGVSRKELDSFISHLRR